MTVTIHRGTHQIGGCVTEIRSENARIIIDMGAELPGEEGAGDFTIDGVTSGYSNCDAVFITHYHGDHCGLYKDILPDIPVYMGEVAKDILLTFAERTHDDGVERIRGFNTFRALDRINVNGICVTPLLVDHSAFDAYMFIIEGEGKRILHTGDFRVHGFRGKAVFPTIRKYVGTVDLLITEGTALSRENKTLLEEAELQTLARHILSESKYVFVLCASTNIDRIAAFYHATPRGKYFICDDYQKSILDIVTKHAKDKASLYDFQKVLTYGSNLDERLRERGFCMLVRCSKYFEGVMQKFPNAIYLFSMWEGYRSGKNQSKTIAAFTANYDFQPFHTSGHASKAVIKAVCDTVKPRVGVIPIHSDAPEVMSELDIGYNVIYLNDGQEFIVS